MTRIQDNNSWKEHIITTKILVKVKIQNKNDRDNKDNKTTTIGKKLKITTKIFFLSTIYWCVSTIYWCTPVRNTPVTGDDEALDEWAFSKPSKLSSRCVGGTGVHFQ